MTLRGALLLLLGGCAATSYPEVAPDATVSGTLSDSVRVIASVQNSGWNAAGTEFATDSTGYASRWRITHASMSAVPPLPPINLARESVAFVSAGTRSSGGYALTLAGSRVTPDSIVITVALQAPGANCGVTAVITEPAIVIALPRTSRPQRITVIPRPGTAC